jgi:outer membrane autotransporter protein
LYLKPKTKLSQSVEIFGRIGFARLNGKTTTSLVTETTALSGVSYGAGMRFVISPTTSLNADYMQYLSKDGTKVNGFSLGVGYKF